MDFNTMVFIFLACWFVFSVWIFRDAKKRNGRYVLSALLMLFCGPFYLPLYLAIRNLKNGEVRNGGRAWYILRNYMILGSIYFGILIIGLSTSDFKRSGIIYTNNIGEYFIIWLIVTLIAVVAWFIIKKSDVKEKDILAP
jgi:hypothetical protein